jgi:5-methylcytosine-specific restriction endonuclease McrA
MCNCVTRTISVLSRVALTMGLLTFALVMHQSSALLSTNPFLSFSQAMPWAHDRPSTWYSLRSSSARRVPYHLQDLVSLLAASAGVVEPEQMMDLDDLQDQDEEFIPSNLPLSLASRSPDNCPALVLNADYQPLSYLPLSIWSWQDAIKAVFSDKADVLVCYDLEVRSPSVAVKLPSVIVLKDYIKRPAAVHVAVLSRKNVFIRDEFKCQYCGTDFTPSQLSLDHLVPRCKGGRLMWQNVVAACHSCNSRKGALMPEQLSKVGLKLQRKPYAPIQLELYNKARKCRPTNLQPGWSEFL